MVDILSQEEIAQIWPSYSDMLVNGKSVKASHEALRLQVETLTAKLAEWHQAVDEEMVVNWIGVFDPAARTPKQAVQWCVEHALDIERDQLRAQVETLTRERDEALDQLRVIVQGLPSPPWMEEQGGSDWEPWVKWIDDEMLAARQREQALRAWVNAKRQQWNRILKRKDNTHDDDVMYAASLIVLDELEADVLSLAALAGDRTET